MKARREELDSAETVTEITAEFQQYLRVTAKREEANKWHCVV